MSNLYENANYEVVVSVNGDNFLILGEDGNYTDRAGYLIRNRETGVVEHTTMVLPQALFQADAFMGALGQLDETPDEVTILGGDADPEILN
jgi:hypothetical protein